MAHTNTDQPAPRDPALVAPVEAEVVDGSEVTFIWESTNETGTYRLQVATDSHFEQLVLDQEVGEAKTITITDVFPEDGSLLYWRVFVSANGQWSSGERIESFTSVTEEEAAAVTVPDRKEELGPAPALLGAVGDEDVTFLADSDEIYQEDAEGAGVEAESINPWTILRSVMVVLLFVTIAVAFVFQLTAREYRSTYTEAVEESGYPMLRETRVEAQQQLTQYDVLNEEEGTYRIPIDRAMDLIVNETYQAGRSDYSGELPLLPRQ